MGRNVRILKVFFMTRWLLWGGSILLLPHDIMLSGSQRSFVGINLVGLDYSPFVLRFVSFLFSFC